MKKFFISFFIVVSLFSTVVYAGNLVKKVYFSPYPISIDGSEYSSETPILQYQDRTYVALREFAEMIGVDVDFQNDQVIINTQKSYEKVGENDSEEEYFVVEIKKEENANNSDLSDVLNDSNMSENTGVSNSTSVSNSRVVYVSKTGKKYHNLSNCNGAEYTGISLSEAISKGYTPCLRCANAK